MRRALVALVGLGAVCIAIACTASTTTSIDAGKLEPTTPGPKGMFKLDHLIFIVQENRSFDHYFGTFPGADGIKFRADGTPKACIPDPVLVHCSRPYASSAQIQHASITGRWTAFCGRRR